MVQWIWIDLPFVTSALTRLIFLEPNPYINSIGQGLLVGIDTASSSSSQQSRARKKDGHLSGIYVGFPHRSWTPSSGLLLSHPESIVVWSIMMSPPLLSFWIFNRLSFFLFSFFLLDCPPPHKEMKRIVFMSYCYLYDVSLNMTRYSRVFLFSLHRPLFFSFPIYVYRHTHTDSPDTINNQVHTPAPCYSPSL